MLHIYNYAKHNSLPAADKAGTQFKQNVGWNSLSPYDQQRLRVEISNQVTQDVHNRIKELRKHLHEAIKNSGLDEKSGLAKIGTFIRDLDLAIQGGRQQ